MAAGKTLAPDQQALSSDMNTIGQWGLAANIPATGDVVAGSFYYETDTKRLKQEQNGVWVDVSGADLSTANAAVGEVKTGKTFFAVEKPVKTGTGTKTLSAASETVEAGYYEATTLSGVDADLAVGNIKKGVVIFGFTGTLAATLTQVIGYDNQAIGVASTWVTKGTFEIPATATYVAFHAETIKVGEDCKTRAMYNSVERDLEEAAHYTISYAVFAATGSAANLDIQHWCEASNGPCWGAGWHT